MRQLKQFNPDTVTPEVASLIMGVVAWNHLAEPKYAGAVTVEDAGFVGTRGGGSHSPWHDGLASQGYVKTQNGVTLRCKTTGHTARLFPDGGIIVHTSNEKPEMHPSQVELVDLYVRLGFLAFDAPQFNGTPVGSVERVEEILLNTPRDRERFAGPVGLHEGVNLLAARTGGSITSAYQGEVFGPTLRTIAASLSEADVELLAAMGWHKGNDGTNSAIARHL